MNKKTLQWDDSGFTVKFLDGTPVDEDDKDRVYRFVAELAALEELLSPHEDSE